jgi:hypothetical protein
MARSAMRCSSGSMSRSAKGAAWCTCAAAPAVTAVALGPACVAPPLLLPPVPSAAWMRAARRASSVPISAFAAASSAAEAPGAASARATATRLPRLR